MLTDIDPLQAFVAGAAVAAVVGFVVALQQRQKNAALETERQRIEAVALKAKEMLAAAPDGLFLWDHANGGFTCSRRLSVLLNLKDGILSRYDDIRERFEGGSLKALEQCVSLLRGAGTPFDVLLTSGRRRIQAIGGRAETDDGKVLADMVWLRDITGTSGEEVGRRVSSINASGLEDRHLTALLDAMPLPVWLRDSKLSLAFINHAARNVVSADAGMADRARVQGASVTERLHVNAGGNERWLEVTETPLGMLGGGETPGDGQGGGSSTGGTIGFAIDRTESETKDDDFNRLGAERDAVLDSLDMGIAIFDSGTNMQYFNAPYAALWDLEPDWLSADQDLGKILERLRENRKLPEMSDFRDFKLRQLQQFETLSKPTEDLLHCPDGRTIRALVNRQGQGKSKGGLVFMFDDVSSQLDLERSMKSLGAVQKETLDNLHEGIAVFGADGRLKLSNPVFASLWGLDVAALNEAFHVSDFVDHSRDHLIVDGGWDDLSWGVHKDKVVNRLMQREAKTGTLELAGGTVIKYANLPLPDGAMLLSYLNITDSAKVETALRQRAEGLAEADNLKNEFIASVSYEVRTPLTTVIGFADMLGQEYFGKLNRRQAEYAKGILNTTNGLMSVVGDILDLASIEAGRLTLDRDTVDVHELLVSALNLIRDRARVKDLKLEFDCPPDIGWIMADGQRLKQVIFNLLTNAATFTNERGSVRLEARRENDELILTVADTGIGIPQSDRERVFEPFTQGSDPGADKTGAGLGLSLVRSFIALHDGDVDVKSPPGRGTTITVRLPAQQTDQAVEPQPGADAGADAGADGALDEH